MSWVPILELNSGNWAGILAWSLVIYGLTYAVFHNPVSSEITLWVQNRLRAVQIKVSNIQHEIKTGRRKTGDSILDAGAQLSDEELNAKAEQLKSAARGVKFERVYLQLLTCHFCKTFWVSLGLGAWYQDGAWSVFLNALGYATLGVMLTRVMAFTGRSSNEQGS